MKYFAVFCLIVVSFYSCKKDTISPQTKALLQNKWFMAEDSIHYPSFSAANSIYIGTDSDYYDFFPDDSVHMQFRTANGGTQFNFTPAYILKSNSEFYLNLNPQAIYTILTLNENALVLSNSVTYSVLGGPMYDGIRITTFKR